jgi:hypothetical protein
MVVGRANFSEERTMLLARGGSNAPDGYAEDFVLEIGVDGGHILRSIPQGVDALKAFGSVAFDGGGEIGPTPAGNGIFAQGQNGVVGCDYAFVRNKSLENRAGGLLASPLGIPAAGAGVVGLAGGLGVFGLGATGVVGYEAATPRDIAFETAFKAGVCGVGPMGVTGTGPIAGVFGLGSTGTAGVGVLATGGPTGGTAVSATSGPGGNGVVAAAIAGAGGIGVVATGDTGMSATGGLASGLDVTGVTFGVDAVGTVGPAIRATSKGNRGGIFRSTSVAQVHLQPISVPLGGGPGNPLLSGAALAGDLIALSEFEGPRRSTVELWFCTVSGTPANPTTGVPAAPGNWVKLA